MCTNNIDSYQSFLKKVDLRKQALRQQLRDILNQNLSFKTLEIGSGHGDFLVEYAKNFPERFCVGIDLITQRIEKSRKKVQRLGLNNCHFLKARAEEFLDCLPESFLWDEIIILYPDPWPKNRHRGNRLFQIQFLSQLSRKVKIGAKIHFETDALDYFKEVCERVQQHPNWRKIDAESYPVNTVFSRITGQKGHHAVFESI